MTLVMPAYTFPREMPLRSDGFHPFEAATFDIAYVQAKAATRGSIAQVVNLAPDYWVMEFQAHPLNEREGMQYHAWLQSLRGGARLFKAWHPLLEFPQAYADDGWDGLVIAGGATPFAGLGALSEISGGRDEITVGSLPAFFRLLAGDMLSIPMPGSQRSLHRVMADATASSGGNATLVVEPALPLGIVDSPSPEVLFEKPYCLATVDAGTIRGPWDGHGHTSVSFRAMQSY